MDAAATPVPEDAHDLDMDQAAAPEQGMFCDAEPAPIVEDPDVAFWKRMLMMMDAQTNRLENNIMIVNKKVDRERIDKESSEQRREAADTAAKVDDVASRVAKLEMGNEGSPASPQVAAPPPPPQRRLEPELHRLGRLPGRDAASSTKPPSQRTLICSPSRRREARL